LLDRITLQKELATAVSDGQLTVLYQPQLDVESGRVVAVEALVRWMHPTRGTIPPDTFIPVAEQSGLITAVDTWVLRTACKTLRGWFDDGLPPMRVAVNLSGRDLERDDLIDTVKQTLHDNMLEPWRLELELTETVAMDQADIATARLQELRTLGVRIAIDDFGTGFSMFSRLRELPVDRLKIDRSFVSDLGRDDDARTIVGSTIAMGHALGLDLVAEGVEDVETAEVLRTLQCDGAQGFYFARPLTAAQLSAWVRSRSDQLAVAAAPSH
jgi:EAL domain-containing protein (putative c-di-GMP-specific phosphodiesterase class I)